MTPAGPMRRATLLHARGAVAPRVLAVLLGSLLDEAMALVVEDPAPPAELEAAAPPTPVVLAAVVVSESGPPPAPSAVEPAVDPARAAAAPDPPRLDDPHDGELHPYAIIDAAVGAVWSIGEQNNVAHLVQRGGVGLLVDSFRAELVLGLGLDQSMDGSYQNALLLETQAFVGASIPTGFAALDLGGVLGLVGHQLVDASTVANDMMGALRIGAALGCTMPDSLALFPFRMRLELGVFARPSPGRVAPFTNVILGLALW